MHSLSEEERERDCGITGMQQGRNVFKNFLQMTAVALHLDAICIHSVKMNLLGFFPQTKQVLAALHYAFVLHKQIQRQR